jgi:hypothetical protein
MRGRGTVDRTSEPSVREDTLTLNFMPDDVGLSGHTSFRSAPTARGAKGAPVFHIRHDAGRTTATGTSKAFVGHRVGPADSSLGLYGSWSWDGTTLQAEVDPLGYFSLFVYQKGGEIAVSPSILQLLALGADPEPDPVALAVFHRIGHFLG